MGSTELETDLICVREGVTLAGAAGLSLTRPTVLSFFKNSGLCRRVGQRYYMPRDAYLEILQGEKIDATNNCKSNADAESC